MSYDGSIKFDTKIDDKGFSKGIKSIGKQANSMTKKAVSGVNTLYKATAGVMAGITGMAIKTGAEFEASMNRVGALADATDDELEKLTATARQLGKDTVFSATEASEAMQNLAMSGFEVNEITATMPGLLDIAAAGQVDLATATDITASTLRGFQRDAEETGRVADVLAKGFTSSNTSLETLGESMKYVAPVASSLEFSIEETTAAIGKLGDAGIQGTQSGTALRAIMLRLVDPPKQAAETMAELGIETRNAQGEMKTFPELIGELEKATEGMTEAEKAATLSKIAGTNASSALMALVNEGADSLKNYTKELENAGGTAEKVAEQQIQGLVGELKLLKSALEEISLKIYDSLDMPLGQFINNLKGYVKEIDNAITTIQNLKDAMGQSGDPGAMPGGPAQDQGIDQISDPSAYLAEVMANVVTNMLMAITEKIPEVIMVGGQFIEHLLEGIQENIPMLTETLSEIFTNLIEGYVTLTPKLLEIGVELITGIIQGIAESAPELMEAFMEAIGSLADTVIESLPTLVGAGANIIVALIDGISDNSSGIIDTMLEVVITLGDAIIDNMDIIIDAGLKLILALAEGLMDGLPKFIEEAPRLVNDFADKFMGALPKILETGVKLIVTLGKGLIKAIPTLIQNIPAIIKAIVNAFMMYNWLQLGKKLIVGIGNGIKGMAGNIGNTAKNVAKGVINAIKNWFKKGTTEGAGLVKNLIGGIKSLVGNLLNTATTLAKDVLTGIKDNFLKAPEIGKNLVQGVWNGINGAKDWLLGKVSEWAGSVMNGIKGFFGIKSPSRKMRDEVGTELVRGIMVGIQDETPALRKVTEQEMLKLVDDYAMYGEKAVEAYAQLSKEEMDELRKKHIKEIKITKDMSQKEIDEAKKQRKKDGEELAKAVAEGIENKRQSIIQAMEKIRQETIRQLDQLGDATIKALERQYKEEEGIILDSIDKRMKAEEQASNRRLDMYQKEYESKLRLLDAETSQEVKLLEDKIELINMELEAQEEAAKQEEYQERLALAKEKARVAKTKRERQEAEKEIQQLIKDEKRRQFEKQKKDEIKALKESIVNIKDNAKEKEEEYKAEYDNKVAHEKEQFELVKTRLDNEKEAVKQHYEELLRAENLQAEARKLILDENNQELIELLDSYNPYWMDAGQSFGESLLDGLNSMKYEIQDVVDDMLTMVSTAEMANARILQAKQDWHEAQAREDKKAMDEAHKRAEKWRKQGGTIGADVAINAKNLVNRSNDLQQARENNPYANGVNQNITIVSPENTPSENARLMKRKSEELMLGY